MRTLGASTSHSGSELRRKALPATFSMRDNNALSSMLLPLHELNTWKLTCAGSLSTEHSALENLRYRGDLARQSHHPKRAEAHRASTCLKRSVRFRIRDIRPDPYMLDGRWTMAAPLN